MCYAVYIGTIEKQEIGKFIPNETTLYLETPTDDELQGLRPKFSKPNIYHVGSDTSCSCGFQFDSVDIDNPDWKDDLKSPARLVDFLKEKTRTEDVEFYCCWEGDWHSDIEIKEEIEINDVSIEENYFGLTEKQFITFKGARKKTSR